MPALGMELMGGAVEWVVLLCVSAIVAAIMPIYMIVHWIVKWSRERKHPSLKFWVITLLIWILSLCGLGASAVKAIDFNADNITTVIQTLEEMEGLEDLDELQELQELEELQD